MISFDCLYLISQSPEIISICNLKTMTVTDKATGISYTIKSYDEALKIQREIYESKVLDKYRDVR